MKKCWKCAEDIQEAAVACRYCGTNQASLDRHNYTAPGNVEARPVIVQAGPAKNSFQSCMGCVGFGILAFCVLAGIGQFL